MRLNPLHCGAVVASCSGSTSGNTTSTVLIPFIAGQWSLPPPHGGGAREGDHVLIPFIAGQWSLRTSPDPDGSGGVGFQSPSLRGSGRFECPSPHGGWARRSFNPLHCGAVVASVDRGSGARRRRRVSIPFIAGQWSLRDADRQAARAGADVSIPFIAGQWSLRDRQDLPGRAPGAFQSPSLRGSGRFAR